MNLRSPQSPWALQLARFTEETRQESTESVDRRVLRWLALLPEWTESLALDCDFPAGNEGIEATIGEAQAAMLCDVVRQSDPAGRETTRFWMPSTMRSWLFDRWEEQGEPRLEEDVHLIASRILRARARRQPVSSGILRWAELAEAELAEQIPTGESLSERVREAIGSGRLSEAGEWLFAAEWLAKALGAPMEMAASRARRQISLHHLRIQDAEYLDQFLPRPDQLEVLEKVAESSEQWGVHFIGLSGVGKTMLMRFISSRHEDNPFARSSRIDFDYLDPRIPLERPAQLLQELSEGFALGLETPAQEALFTSFLRAVRAAESARVAMGPDLAALAAGSRQFHQALEAFALFLNSLPQPVALVLDTCEELAKLHPPGGQMWSVNATFHILERLRLQMPELKLIIAGRRWLTAEYADRKRMPPTPDEVLNAPARKFLRFYESRGFTEQEVRSYLREVRHLDLGEELTKTILDSTEDLQRVPDADAGEEEKDLRYSPNDVAFCATLLKEAPEVGRKAVEEGNFDAYVEKRILGRLQRTPELVEVFPAAAILGHFDAAVIEPVLGKTPGARRALLARLIAEDWTHLEGGPEPEEIVLRVDPGLLPRLRAYYGREGMLGRQRQREEARRKLQRHLAEKLAQGPPAATIEVADAAVRLLDPAQVVRSLEQAEARVVETAAWSWAEAVAQRLLDHERDPNLDQALLAAVWTLYLTGMKHSQVSFDLDKIWDGVAKMAAAHPDPQRRKLLQMRSRLASLAEAPAGAEPAPRAAAVLLDQGRRLLPKRHGETLASALLAATEKLIDAREERGREVAVASVAQALERLGRHFDGRPGMQAHVAALRGRLQALEGELAAASNAFTEVALHVREADEPVPMFTDWVGPSSLAARAVLELLRFRLATGEIGEGLLSRGEEVAYAAAPGSDSAQLLSLVIQARLAKGTPSLSKIERARWYEAQLESYRLTAPAHRTAPPLFVSVASGLMACGRTEGGLRLLRERERIATSRRTEEGSTGAAAIALLVTLRRLRLREGLALANHLMGDQRAEALAAGALIAGVQPTLPPKTEDDHAAWRVRNLVDLTTPRRLLSKQESDEGGGYEMERIHRLLDLLESELVAQRWEGRSNSTETASWLWLELNEAAQHGDPPMSLADPLGREQMRLRLRFLALLDDHGPVMGEGLKAQLAEIALEEGELLALRLPDHAIDLLELASRCFVEGGDPRGAFVAELRLAIAEIHAGRRRDAAGRRQRILERYEQMRRERQGLPALGALLERETHELIERNDPWRGWIWRLVFYLRWCGGLLEDGSASAATAMEFGPEFKLRPAAGFDRGGRAVGRGVRRQRLAAQWPILYRWLPVLAVLVILAVLGLGTTLLLMLAIPVTLLGVAAIEVVGPRLPRRVLPLSGFDLSLISLARGGQGPTVLAYGFVAARPRARLLPLRLYLLALTWWRLPTYSMIPTGGSMAAGERLPENVHQALRRRLLGGYPPLRLEVGPNLAWVPWERILLSGVTADPRWRPRRSPQVIRMRPRDFPSPQPLWFGDVATICAPKWRLFLERSSEHKVRWLLTPSVPAPQLPRGRTAIGEEVTEEPGSSRAVIAMGAPVETKAGWRLRLDEDELSEPLPDLSEPRMQQLVKPDLLARRFPLVVLVPPPGGDPAGADRQVAEGLRSLANEIFLAGAHGVIVLPVLPPAVAASAIEILVKRCDEWQEAPDEGELRRWVEEVQTCVYENLEEDDDDQDVRRWRVDLVLDICLFGPRPEKGG